MDVVPFCETLLSDELNGIEETKLICSIYQPASQVFYAFQQG